MSGRQRVIYQISFFVPVSSNAVLETPGTVSLLSLSLKVNGEEMKYKLVCNYRRLPAKIPGGGGGGPTELAPPPRHDGRVSWHTYEYGNPATLCNLEAPGHDRCFNNL